MCVRGYYVVFKGKELVLRTTIIQGHVSADTHNQLTQTLQQLILQLRTRYSIPKLTFIGNTIYRNFTKSMIHQAKLS